MGHPVRVGLFLQPQSHSLDVIREAWRIADEGGADHIWGFDHLLAIGDDLALPVHDGGSVLTMMALTIKRARFGLHVFGNLYRHPGLLAKIAVTADHLSGGRLEMGIGAAWKEIEFTQIGMPFPGARERIERLDEACAVLRLLWTEPRATFRGEHYVLEDAICEPKPVQRPHPPIWIGGSGPRRTLRVVARHADVWNSNNRDFTENVALAAILDEHCRAIGRDPALVRRSAELRFESVDEAAAAARAYVAAGFTELIVRVVGPDPRGFIERAARELIPRLKQLA